MNKKTVQQSQLLNVQNAADLLGVNAGTIRRWVRNKQLKGIKVGIRGDWRFTKEDVLEMVSSHHKITSLHEVSTKEIEKPIATYTNNASINGHEHSVQFYEQDEFLLHAVSKFISAGEAAIIVASNEHRQQLEALLQSYWPDLAIAKAKGQFVSLDAHETLEKFMVEGMPDSGSFFEVMGNLIMRTARGGHKVRIFGEMVAILWMQGNKQGAIKLEELWNDLQKNHFFSLYCAYPLSSFNGKEHTSPFNAMNDQHSQVFPSESYYLLSNKSAQLREVAILQQKAQALESENLRGHEIENRLRLSENRYRRLFEASKDGVLIIDFETQQIIDANPFMEELLGMHREMIIGRRFSETIFVQGTVSSSQFFEKLLTDRSLRYDMILPKATGDQCDIEIVATMYKENNRMVVQCDMRDITKRKQMERRKDDFMSIVSHELKTPVTSLKAYAQVLQHKFQKAGDLETANHFAKMDSQINKLTGLIGDLLDITKIQGGKLRFNETSFPFDELVDEVIEEVQRTTDRHKIIRKGTTGKDYYGDRDRIGQVLTNLLTNAIKYSPDANQVIVQLSAQKKQLQIAVQDFGIGISDDEQSLIFDRFYRESDASHSTFPGLGLGLFISSRIVERHNGKIWVESKKGKGSTFLVTLPLT